LVAKPVRAAVVTTALKVRNADADGVFGSRRVDGPVWRRIFRRAVRVIALFLLAEREQAITRRLHYNREVERIMRLRV
jgi:hypothetical protein